MSRKPNNTKLDDKKPTGAKPVVDVSSITTAPITPITTAPTVPASSASNTVAVKMVLTDEGKKYGVPKYKSANASGMDLYAAISEPIKIRNRIGEMVSIPTGVKIGLPVGYEGQIRSRSGLAAKQGIVVANAPGTIDSDYTGEIIAILCNLKGNTMVITPGMRIAQLVIAPVSSAEIELVELDETARGEDGLGSTGLD